MFWKYAINLQENTHYKVTRTVKDIIFFHFIRIFTLFRSKIMRSLLISFKENFGQWLLPRCHKRFWCYKMKQFNFLLNFLYRATHMNSFVCNKRPFVIHHTFLLTSSWILYLYTKNSQGNFKKYSSTYFVLATYQTEQIMPELHLSVTQFCKSR